VVTASGAGAGDLGTAVGAGDLGTDLGTAAPAVTSDEIVGNLYECHAVRLIRMAVLLVGDQSSAEDVVQDAFLGLYRSLGRLRDPANAAAYLRTCVVNGCRSVLRSRKRSWHALAATPDPPVWSAESAAMAGEDRREVLQAVRRLPRRQREVLVLRYYLNLSDPEIAADLGVTRGTVASTASRALAALGRELGEQL
jgi:RNA polymerase sigma-70 factor (sigma-E family)